LATLRVNFIGDFAGEFAGEVVCVWVGAANLSYCIYLFYNKERK
jgi:hypothetical protein